MTQIIIDDPWLIKVIKVFGDMRSHLDDSLGFFNKLLEKLHFFFFGTPCTRHQSFFLIPRAIKRLKSCPLAPAYFKG